MLNQVVRCRPELGAEPALRCGWYGADRGDVVLSRAVRGADLTGAVPTRRTRVVRARAVRTLAVRIRAVQIAASNPESNLNSGSGRDGDVGRGGVGWEMG